MLKKNIVTLFGILILSVAFLGPIIVRAEGKESLLTLLSASYPVSSPQYDQLQAGITITPINIDGKRNTEILIFSVSIFLVLLVALGYVLKGGKKSAKALVLVAFSLLASGVILPVKTYAVCPVCTIAVGTGLGLSRTLGIDDTIMGVWAGGLTVSTIFWIIDWFNKRRKSSAVRDIIISIVTYLLVFVPLQLAGFMGHPLNTLWGIDKLFLGVIFGSIGFFLGARLHYYLKKQNGEKAVFPFQKVVVPISSMLILTIIFYLIVY